VGKRWMKRSGGDSNFKKWTCRNQRIRPALIKMTATLPDFATTNSSLPHDYAGKYTSIGRSISELTLLMFAEHLGLVKLFYEYQKKN